MSNNWLSSEAPQTTGGSAIQGAASTLDDKQAKKEKNWFIFVMSFLKLAEAGSDFLIKCKKLTEERRYIFVSIIFNLKHALEVLLKHVSVTQEKELDGHHEITRLAEALEKQLKKNKPLQGKVKKIDKYIKKYCELEFLVEYFKNSFAVLDDKNTFFKYPDNSTKLIIDYSKLTKNISKSDISNIKIDIVDITKLIKEIKKEVK